MTLDPLFYTQGSNEKQSALLAWAKNAPGLQLIPAPDYHRLQMEKWIWDGREKLGRLVMDVAHGETPRRWFGEGYFTFGLDYCDVLGDLLDIPLADGSLDGVIVTEVLEHCSDPFCGVAEIRRVLKPGGVVFATSPFIWSWHGRTDYEDYWRFTHQGWKLLFREFSKVEIKTCEWTDEGEMLWNLLRRFEGFGHTGVTLGATGYLVEAVK